MENKTTHNPAVLGFCELLALMFGLPPGEALYHGDPIGIRMVGFIVLGVFFAILGPGWPFVMRTFPQQRLFLTLGGVASDFRYWLGILLFIFVYVVGPGLYRGAVETPPTLPSLTTLQSSHLDFARIIDLTNQLNHLESQLGVKTQELEAIKRELETAKLQLKAHAQQAQRETASYRNKMSAQKTLETVRLLSGVFLQNPHATMVITAPPENEAFKKDFYAMIVAACQREPTAYCTIEPAPNLQLDIDSGITDPQYSGIVIHHKASPTGDYTADNFISALTCYVVRKGSLLPEGIARLNVNNTPHFYWFELGHGSPWQPDNNSSCD